MKLYQLIPHRWMTRRCKGKCGDTSPHTADVTFLFRLAYGSLS